MNPVGHSSLELQIYFILHVYNTIDYDIELLLMRPQSLLLPPTAFPKLGWVGFDSTTERLNLDFFYVPLRVAR